MAVGSPPLSPLHHLVIQILKYYVYIYICVCVLRMTLLKGLPNRWIMVDYNHLSGIVIQAMLDPFIVDPRTAA